MGICMDIIIQMNQGFGNTAWERYCSDEEFDKLTIAQKDAMVEDYIWNIIDYPVS